jgi:hypothetical protein
MPIREKTCSHACPLKNRGASGFGVGKSGVSGFVTENNEYAPPAVIGTT